MKIELKSDRRVYIYVLLPFLLISLFFTGILSYVLIKDYNIDNLKIEIMFIILDIFILLLLSWITIFPRKKFCFENNSITIYRQNGKLLHTIFVSNIEYIHYYPLKLHYIFTVAYGSLSEGGAMKLHIKEKDGKTHVLGSISYKKAKLLRSIYPSLLTIFYEK